MSKPRYIENIFIDFYEEVLIKRIPVQPQDKQPMTSFYNILVQGQRITLNQSNFILKILKKYKDICFINNEDLENPQWQHSFRTIDMSKKVFVEKDNNDNYWVCLKFPYQLKNIVEKDIIGNGYQYYGDNKWDKDRRLRQLKLLDYNIIQIYDFVKKHNFEIDESFFDALAVFEDVWQDQDSITPMSTITDGKIELINATDDAQIYFDENAIGDINNDLFLAKSMSYTLDKIPETIVEKITASAHNCFWIQSFKKFFDLSESISGTIAFVLDRNEDQLVWLKQFAASVDSYEIDRKNVCVCFRASNNNNKNFNDWIKAAGFTGKIDDQKYLIFLSKPPKWLFKRKNSVKIIVTNNLFSPSMTLTRSWMEQHPCTIYLGEIKPSLKDKNIVEL